MISPIVTPPALPGDEVLWCVGVDTIEHGYEASEATLKLMRAKGAALIPTLEAVAATSEYGGVYGLARNLTDGAPTVYDAVASVQRPLAS